MKKKVSFKGERYQHWASVPLREVVVPVNRMEVPKPGILYRRVGVRWWGQGISELEPVDDSQANQRLLFKVATDDLLVDKVWALRGCMAVVPANLDGCYVYSGVLTFAPRTERLHPRWLYWLIKMREFWPQYGEKRGGGLALKSLPLLEHLLNIQIPLPPLEEQQRMAARLDELTAKIEEAHNLLQTTMEKAKKVPFTAARRYIARASKEVTPLKNWLDPEREGIKTGPSGGELSWVAYGSSGIPILTNENIQESGVYIEPDVLAYIVEERATIPLDNYRLKAGDLLFTRVGEVRYCLVPEAAEGWLFDYHISRVSVDRNRVEPRYMLWMARASADVEAYLPETIPATDRERMKVSLFAHLPCRMPALAEQRRIADHLDSLQARIDALERLQEERADLLRALLPAALKRALKGTL